MWGNDRLNFWRTLIKQSLRICGKQIAIESAVRTLEVQIYNNSTGITTVMICWLYLLQSRIDWFPVRLLRGGRYSHIVWVGVCRWIRESPTLLLDQILQIVWPYTRLKMLNCSWYQSFVSDPVKRDPILDQFSMITRPYTRPNGLKTIPFQRHIPV